MDKDSLSIYEKLRELRRSKGLTVSNFAKKIGETDQKVGRIERGITSLTVDYLVKATKALGTTLDSFIEKEDKLKIPPSDSSSDPQVLNQVILFVEEECNHLTKKLSPSEKANFISTIYEQVLSFPKNIQLSVLQSLGNILKLIKPTLHN